MIGRLLLLILSFNLCAYAYAGGTVAGTVKFEGTAPRSRMIHMEADPVCYASHDGKTVYSQTLVLGDNGGLGNVFVYVKSGLGKTRYPVPPEIVVVNQKGCNYNPHVLGVMVGQKVKFLNPDGTLHNVHAMCKSNPEFNAAMPDFRKEMQVSFEKPEFMFPIRCDVHPWMTAWMAVMGHPFFTVTNSDGRFELKDLPDGTYTIEAWHEKLGTKVLTITLKEGKSDQRADFTFLPPK
ncbi:MAG: hypothetical protein HQL14_04730 [Candidatus Omnitrophica bacterium]|nr:hypothetical protein [Candidatus Omnitrophota bacterium]